MKQKRIRTIALLLALVLALLPAGVQATPPIGGQSISFGASNDVGASADSVSSAAVGDLDNDGDLDVVTGSGSGEDYEVIAWRNGGMPFSGTWTQSDVGASTDVVTSVALGDLDNDGYLDVVTGSGSGENFEVIVWQNDGVPFGGTWTQRDVGASTASVYSVAVGDLDNDGDLDIVSGSGLAEDYEVIAWENDGTPFDDAWTLHDVGTTSTDDVYSVAVGDLDNDGDLDIVSGSDSADYEVIAWQNNGAPFSGAWTPCSVGASTDNVWSVAVGDLDNDGDLDIVSGSGSGEDYEVIAWENDGTPFSGTWPQNDVGASTDNVTSVAVGDLDNDGCLDIVSGSSSGEDYEVIAWENGGIPFVGTWTQRDVGASTSGVNSVALGDLDSDGDLDVVTGSGWPEDYEVIAWQNTLAHGDLSFGPAGNDVGASTDHVSSVAVGDLDNDGDLDVVSGSGSGEDSEVIAWQNDGAPFDSVWPQQNVGASTASVYSVALGDLDHDGYLDIVAGCGSGEDYEIRAWRNDGTPFNSLWVPQDVGASTDDVWSVAVGDLDHDGDLDVVTGSGSAENYEVIAWQNSGAPFSGAWTQNDVGASTDDVWSVALGDLDHDGCLDIVSGSDSGEDREVIAWQNDGAPFSGTWTQNDVGASAASVNSVAVGNLSYDSYPEIVSGSSAGEDYEVITWQSDETPFSGLWVQSDVGASTTAVFAVTVGDLDNDGDLDIVSGSGSGEDYEVIAWETPLWGLDWIQHDVGASAADVLSVAVGDLDNDGDLDIVSGSYFPEDYEIIAWQNTTGSAAPSTGSVYLPIILKNASP